MCTKKFSLASGGFLDNELMRLVDGHARPGITLQYGIYCRLAAAGEAVFDVISGWKDKK